LLVEDAVLTTKVTFSCWFAGGATSTETVWCWTRTKLCATVWCVTQQYISHLSITQLLCKSLIYMS